MSPHTPPASSNPLSAVPTPPSSAPPRTAVDLLACVVAARDLDHQLPSPPASGQVDLLGLAKKTHPGLLVSTSGLGGGTMPREVARAADFLLIHFNDTKLDDIPVRVKALKEFGKPIVCNEDAKTGHAGAKAADLCVASGASWGLMVEGVNQHYPFRFGGAADDRAVYAVLKKVTSP
jgi:hypothetical protein